MKEQPSSPFPLPSSPREGQTFDHRGSRWLAYVNFVKLPHTLFALPFALLGVLAASRRAPVTLTTLGLVVVAFSAARWVAMVEIACLKINWSTPSISMITANRSKFLIRPSNVRPSSR